MHLTPHQHILLLAIRKHWATHGRAPTVVELSIKFDQSKQNIYQHLRKLKKAGYSLTKSSDFEAFQKSEHHPMAKPIKQHGALRYIPILAQTTTGVPIYTDQHVQGGIWFEWSCFDTLFALHVRSHALNKIGIMEGDLVILRQQASYSDGDLVLALIECKHCVLQRLKQQDQLVYLLPENDALQPTSYPIEQVIIQGKVIASRRLYETFNDQLSL